MRKLSVAFAAVLCALAAGCGGGNKKIVAEDFAEGRVVDLSISEKLTGNRELLFVSLPQKTRFLEGYIQGIITDYKDNPVQGVVVRAVASGESAFEDSGSRSFAVSAFDPGVSDTNGFYKIRFTLPIIDKVVDVRGRLLYNPGWEQERESLGKAFEPQLKQSPFRLYYNNQTGQIIFGEGVRKSIVAPVLSAHGGKAAQPGGRQADASDKPEKSGGDEPKKGGDEDLFKGFGFGP